MVWEKHYVNLKICDGLTVHMLVEIHFYVQHSLGISFLSGVTLSFNPVALIDQLILSRFIQIILNLSHSFNPAEDIEEMVGIYRSDQGKHGNLIWY